MTSDVQVTVRTDRATQDDISYQDYWEIYHFELRKWDESMARRDGKKSPDGKVLLGDYLLSLDDFCELHSPDMSKAMWSKIHKALREYVDLKLLIEDEKTAEESRTAALAALPAAEAEVAKALTRRARNILRRNTGQPELPISVEQALAEEEKRFASVTKDSLHELGRARDWAYYAKTGEDRIRARAAQRGDTLAVEDGRTFLRLAMSYYEQADRPDGVSKIREKARMLAKRHEAKGEGEVAAEFYSIAGDDKQAETVQKQTEQRQAQAEEGRKKTFKKEQADLEKALGF